MLFEITALMGLIFVILRLILFLNPECELGEPLALGGGGSRSRVRVDRG